MAMNIQPSWWWWFHSIVFSWFFYSSVLVCCVLLCMFLQGSSVYWEDDYHHRHEIEQHSSSRRRRASVECQSNLPGIRLTARFTEPAQPSQCITTLRITVRNSTVCRHKKIRRPPIKPSGDTNCCAAPPEPRQSAGNSGRIWAQIASS